MGVKISAWAGVASVILAVLHVTACETYDCKEACGRDRPICESEDGLDCRSMCESYLGTEDCVSEGERLLECFEGHPGACNGYCDPDEPAPACIAGCEDSVREYTQCFWRSTGA